MKLRRFVKNIASKQAIMGAVIICLIMCIAATSTYMIPLKADDGPFDPTAYTIMHTEN